jgi:hypothetical protein
MRKRLPRAASDRLQPWQDQQNATVAHAICPQDANATLRAHRACGPTIRSTPACHADDSNLIKSLTMKGPSIHSSWWRGPLLFTTPPPRGDAPIIVRHTQCRWRTCRSIPRSTASEPYCGITGCRQPVRALLSFRSRHNRIRTSDPTAVRSRRDCRTVKRRALHPLQYSAS